MSRRTESLPCGCAYYLDREAWAELCRPHGAEHAEIHSRAMADYRRAEAAREIEQVNGSATAEGSES